eukprot:TCONS_00028018-protein
MSDSSFVIGIDVGGTNTDVAIVQGHKVVGWNKSSTTPNIIDGVIQSIEKSLKNTQENGYPNVRNEIARISIGTTHFINAVIKRTGLTKTACIRLCGVSSQALPPFTDFPKDLKEKINGGSYLLNGGFEFDGRVITEVDEQEIIDVITAIQQNGVEHVAISGIFSPMNDSQERLVKRLINKHAPELTCTTSCSLGYLGLLERENATILNESLKELCQKTISGFRKALSDIGLNCPMFFTQNDGTLISEQQTLDFPVFTFSSGATNSMRGAVHLSSLKNAIVVDIGGTSTDVGVLVNGFPREASTRVKVAGVNTNFRMPDVHCIGVGGGSYVVQHNDQTVTVGPGSVEYRLKEEALVFGGKTLVATDIAVASGLVKGIGNESRVSHLSKDLVEQAVNVIQESVERAVDFVKLSKEDYPVVLVGGGSILIDVNKPFKGASKIIKPPFYQVANAVGAALSQVSGTFDKLIEVKEDQNSREMILQQAKDFAINQAVQNGAIRSTCTILDVQEINMTYVALSRKRLIIKAVGDLQETVSVTNTEKDANVGTEKLDRPVFDGKINDSNVSSVITDKDISTRSNNPQSHQQQTLPSPPNIEKDNYQPKVNDQGEWELSGFDVECLALGAGLLGCGGGGSPYLGKLELLRCMEEGYQPKIIHPKSFKDGFACTADYMGAPEVADERLSNKTELSDVLNTLQNLFEMGFNAGQSLNEIKAIATKNNLKIETMFNGKCHTVDYKNGGSCQNLPKSILVAEIGGANALCPLTVAARLGLPVVDCDGMGRAFPEIQHYGPFICGSPAYPAVLCDNHGQCVCCVYAETADDLESFFRDECVKAGCSAAISISCFDGEKIRNEMCQHTLTQAWKIGHVILHARKSHCDVTNAILNECNGVLIAKGKISDLSRQTKDGFTFGRILIEGTELYQGQNIIVEFQNEYLIARKDSTNQGLASKELSNEKLASTPDLISLVESDTGEPIQSSELRYGIRVSVLVLPAPPLMTSSKALEFVGPKAFGYDNVDYEAVGEYKLYESIAKVVE